MVNVHLVANGILYPRPGVRIIVPFVAAGEVVVQSAVVSVGQMERVNGADWISRAVQHGSTGSGRTWDPIANSSNGCVGLKIAIDRESSGGRVYWSCARWRNDAWRRIGEDDARHET